MRDVFSLEPTTIILQDASYIASYPHLVGYFAAKDQISTADVVCGAHMAYGWMPTILEIYPDPARLDLDSAATILTKAKKIGALSPTEIDALAGLVNNSLVGASKLLHFVAPNSFAIWDSKVYSFIHEKRPHHYRVNSASSYLEYLATLEKIAKRGDFARFHSSVQDKVGYSISPMRAIELVMFLNAPAYGG